MSEYAMLMLMKKHVAPAHPPHYLVWLGLSMAGFIVIWYCVFLIGTVMLTALGDAVIDDHYSLYVFILSFGGVVITYLAAAAVLPFALWSLKRLKIQDPVQGAVGAVMGITFASVLFFTLMDYTFNGHQEVVPIVSTVSVLVAALLYGVVLRRLKLMVSKRVFIIICVGLPLIVYGVDLLNRMTSFN